MPLEKLLTMDEAADILSVTKKTLLSHIREGRIRYINIGNGTERESRRFRPSDIEAFIRDQSRVCPPVDRKAKSEKRRKSATSTPDIPAGGIRALLAQQDDVRALIALQENRKKQRK